MITITSTAESLEQAKALLEAGVDRLYIGEKNYGLRVPTALTNEEIQKITELAHDAGKTVTVAVNALMHTEMMAKIKDFLDFLVEIKADRIAVGDAGVIFVLQRDKYELPFFNNLNDLELKLNDVIKNETELFLIEKSKKEKEEKQSNSKSMKQ